MRFHGKKSVYWEYVLVCTALTLITCLCLGIVFGTCYLHAIRDSNRRMLAEQSQRAVDALDAQIDSMQQLALRLSSQQMYRYEYIGECPYNTIEAARSLSQYESYCTLADRFALLFQSENGARLLLSDGTTADLNVFLNTYGFSDTEAVQNFLFEEQTEGRVLHSGKGMLFAYAVPKKHFLTGDIGGTLCFAVPHENLRARIRLASTLGGEKYSLTYLDEALLSEELTGETVCAAGEHGFCIQVSVPELSLFSLLTSARDIIWLCLCVVALFVSIFALAWRCYRPIRSLSAKYPSDTPTGIKNELFQLDHVISQMQSRSELMGQEAIHRTAILRDYVLRMLLNNSGQVTIGQDLEKAGIFFPYPHFAVITLMPCDNLILTPENMDTLKRVMNDIAEDVGYLEIVECNSRSHILAIICNNRTPEEYALVTQRLQTYLNAQTRRFFTGTGQLTDTLAGVSASYLSALSELRRQSGSGTQIAGSYGDSELIEQIVLQIENGNTEQALQDLETYMSAIGENPSELVRRYHGMRITCAVQQLCTRLEFQLTEEQMSMLLSMRSVDAICFALKKLIPPLCEHVRTQGGQKILSTESLVMGYLRENYCVYDISVQKIAEGVGIGINRAAAIIRQVTGHSFKTTLTQMRIGQAKKLLAEGMSVAEAGSTVGYSSASYFIKVFKTSEGVTPDAYRKAAQKKRILPPVQTI